MTHPNTPQCPSPCGLCPERWPVPAGSEVDGERAEFEAWAKPRVFSLVVPDDDPDEYKELETASAWEAWQARAAMGESLQARAEQTCFGAGDVVRIRDIALAVFHGCGQEARDVIEWYHSSLLVETERDRAALASSVQAQAGGVAAPGMVPAAWEYRLRISGMREVWTDWKRCSQAASADYANSQDPQWEYETRVLYAATPAATPQAGAGMVLAEREALRAGQSAAVMPLIGPLLDAWDGMSNDARAEVLDEAPDLAKYLSRIGHAMEAAPSPTPAPAATPQAGAGMVLVPLGLIQRAQQAINWHLEPNSPDEHERTMLELSAIGWPEEHAQVEAALQAAPSPAPAPAATTQQAEPQAAAEPYGFESGLVQLLNEARCLSPETVGNRELAGRVMKYIRMHWTQPAPAPAQQLSDEQIEALLQRCGGKWNGDYWVIEDADLHPFVRAAMQQKGGAV